MKSVMLHDFSRIPQTNIQRSSFDRSHGYKTTFDSGYLIPFYLDEVLPGDEFNVRAQLLAKMTSPLISQPMDNIFLDTFYFFVPSRLIWSNFTKMMGERVSPNDSIDYVVPTVTPDDPEGFKVGSLADYFGIPVNVPLYESGVNALPFRAYAKIWDDWFRDENLQDSIIKTSDDIGDGNPNSVQWNTLLKRGKRKDYFTSALPWPQKGDGVEIPLGGWSPVYGDGHPLLFTDGSGTIDNSYQHFGYASSATSANTVSQVNLSQYDNSIESPAIGDLGSVNGMTITASTASKKRLIGVPTKEQAAGEYTGLQADLTSATSATINSLRMAFQLQRMLEADARGGTRYTEIIRQHFNTISPDARLQRSEFLGSSSQSISLKEIVQMTSGTDGTTTTPFGTRGANGVVSDVNGFRKAFTEHGYVIGLVSVRADLTYQQGLDRLWSRRGRYDFYWPTLAHLGEQAVLNKEIYCQGEDALDSLDNKIDDKVFGYQERYAEYRYHPSRITGKLRSGVSGSLDYWHLSQYFGELPTLSAEFIEENPPLKRILAIQDEPEFVFDSYISCKCIRPMPVYSVPGLIDHF